MDSTTETSKSQEITKEDGSVQKVHRNNLGQFVKGVSGNPKGKPKGSKNRAGIIKQAMEEALVRDSAKKFNKLVDTALDLAIQGDKDMLKFFLGDVLKETRRMEGEEEESKKIGKIEIKFSPFQGETTSEKEVTQANEKAIEGEYQELVNITPKTGDK